MEEEEEKEGVESGNRDEDEEEKLTDGKTERQTDGQTKECTQDSREAVKENDRCEIFWCKITSFCSDFRRVLFSPDQFRMSDTSTLRPEPTHRGRCSQGSQETLV